MLPSQVRNRVEEFLFGEEAFVVEQFNQRAHLPHVGDGQLVEGDEVFGVKLFSHGPITATRRQRSRRLQPLG